MKTKAVRLYGENDVRLEEFALPEIKNGEILIKIISDSVCMSTYKTIKQGAKHLRVPDDVAEHPVIIGHEFCAEIVEVGERWKNDFAVGDKVICPPVLSYLGGNKTIGYCNGVCRAFDHEFVSTEITLARSLRRVGFLSQRSESALFSPKG